MRGFNSAGHAKRFLATFGVIASLLRPGRHLLAARNYREIMRRRFAERSQVTDSDFAIQ
jgi:putative transposase